jgi:hypothetical protein
MIYKPSFSFTIAMNADTALLVLLMIETACKKNDNSQAQSNVSLSVMLGSEENVIPPASPGLFYSPDEHLSYLANAWAVSAFGLPLMTVPSAFLPRIYKTWHP